MAEINEEKTVIIELENLAKIVNEFEQIFIKHKLSLKEVIFILDDLLYHYRKQFDKHRDQSLQELISTLEAQGAMKDYVG